jgi:hypothetical protein
MTKHAHIPFHTTTQVRPQGCHVREHGCRQLLKLVVVKVQPAATESSPRKNSQIATARVLCLLGFTGGGGGGGGVT